MIKFKELLFEGRTNSISKERALEISNNKIGNLITNKPIYRGLHSNFKYGFVQPRQYSRESAHTKNYYTMIIDNSKKWSSYSKRSESIIAFTFENRARQFGTVYLIYSTPEAKIGVCPSVDIWVSFNNLEVELGIKDLSELNKAFNYLSEFCLGKNELNQNWPGLKNDLNAVGDHSDFKEIYKNDDIKDSLGYSTNILILVRRLADKYFAFYKNVTLFEMIEDLMEPEENNLKIQKFNSDFYPPKNVEVWTSSPALLIRKSAFTEDFL